MKTTKITFSLLTSSTKRPNFAQAVNPTAKTTTKSVDRKTVFNTNTPFLYNSKPWINNPCKNNAKLLQPIHLINLNEVQPDSSV